VPYDQEFHIFTLPTRARDAQVSWGEASRFIPVLLCEAFRDPPSKTPSSRSATIRSMPAQLMLL